MKSNKLYTALGTLVVLIPFLGIPTNFKNTIIIILGMTIIIYSIEERFVKKEVVGSSSLENKISE